MKKKGTIEQNCPYRAAKQTETAWRFVRPRKAAAIFSFAALLLLAFIPSHAHAQDTSTGLVGHWTLDETNGTTAFDSAGSTNGTMQSGLDAATATAPGVIGTGLDFTPNNTINLGDYDMSSDFSISVWFNADVVDGAWRSIVMRNNNYGIETRFGNLYFRVGSSWGNDVSTGGLAADTWYHAVLTYDGGTNTLTGYLDGVSLGTNTSAFTNTNDDTAIGSWSNFQEYFDGTIDDVRFYNRVLTPADVTALYNRTVECSNTVAGQMIYNENYRVMQYCDGTNWESMGKGASILHGQKTEGNDYAINAVEFDGTSDNLIFNNSGTTSLISRTFSGSFWIKSGDVGTSQSRVIHGSGGTPTVFIQSDGSIRIVVGSDGGTPAYDINCSTAAGVLQNETWHHVSFSFDTTDDNRKHIYVDDVDVTPAGDCLTNSGLLRFSDGHWVGGINTAYYDMDLADVWFSFNTYIDLSVAANRRLFTNASGQAINLGSNGELPTGSAPDIFLSGDTASWHTNLGTAGGFTENGALTDATTLPPSETARKLVGWWRMDETTGTVAADSSASGNDATLTNVTFDTNSVSGPTSTGLDTNTGDALTGLQVNNNGVYTGLTKATISFWVNPDDFASGSTFIDIEDVFRVDTPIGQNRIFFRANAWDGTAGSWNSDSLTLNAQEWNHVAVTYDYDDPVGTRPIIYVNGVANASPAVASNPTGNYARPADATTYISRRHDSTNSYVRGKIDDVRLYNFALDAAQIDELYHASSDFYRSNAVEFDNTTYLQRGGAITGLSDCPSATASFWIRRNSGYGTTRMIWDGGGSNSYLSFDPTDRIFWEGVTLRGSTAITDNNWHHYLISFNATTGERHVYLDDVAETLSNTMPNSKRGDFSCA